MAFISFFCSETTGAILDYIGRLLLPVVLLFLYAAQFIKPFSKIDKINNESCVDTWCT